MGIMFIWFKTKGIRRRVGREGRPRRAKRMRGMKASLDALYNENVWNCSADVDRYIIYGYKLCYLVLCYVDHLDRSYLAT